jgi:hypothetical protein
LISSLSNSTTKQNKNNFDKGILNYEEKYQFSDEQQWIPFVSKFHWDLYSEHHRFFRLEFFHFLCSNKRQWESIET